MVLVSLYIYTLCLSPGSPSNIKKKKKKKKDIYSFRLRIIPDEISESLLRTNSDCYLPRCAYTRSGLWCFPPWLLVCFPSPQHSCSGTSWTDKTGSCTGLFSEPCVFDQYGCRGQLRHSCPSVHGTVEGWSDVHTNHSETRCSMGCHRRRHADERLEYAGCLHVSPQQRHAVSSCGKGPHGAEIQSACAGFHHRTKLDETRLHGRHHTVQRLQPLGRRVPRRC